MPITETVRFRWQYCDTESNRDITGDMHAEEDADQVRAWEGAHGDMCLLAIQRTPRKLWRVGTSDVWLHSGRTYAKRFRTPQDALQYVATLNGAQVTDAVCRCGTADDCD